MELRKIIASGRYRDCYATDNPGVCVKRLKTTVRKKYFWIEIWYPSKWYMRRKFGIWNFNAYEHQIYSSLPEELKPYIPSLIEIHNEDLVLERVRNASWLYSSTLEESWIIVDEVFWAHIHRIRDIFVQRQLWFLDVFHKWNNILVKQDEDGHSSPVLIDLKRLWRDTYPFQLNLLFPGQVAQKFTRRFENFKANFKWSKESRT